MIAEGEASEKIAIPPCLIVAQCTLSIGNHSEESDAHARW